MKEVEGFIIISIVVSFFDEILKREGTYIYKNRVAPTKPTW